MNRDWSTVWRRRLSPWGQCGWWRAAACRRQQLLHTFDGISVSIEEQVDPLDECDVFGAIIAPIAGALKGAQLGKARFPITQNVLVRKAEALFWVAAMPVTGQL